MVKKMIRPTKIKRKTALKFNADVKFMISLKASEGRTDSEIAKALGVNYSTLQAWLKSDPKFKELVREQQREVARQDIAVGLRHLAQGFVQETIKEEKVVIEVDDMGNEITKKITTSKKTMPPDTKALAMLANKFAPNEYSGEDQNTLNIRITGKNTSMSIEDRLALLNDDAKVNQETFEAQFKKLESDWVEEED